MDFRSHHRRKTPDTIFVRLRWTKPPYLYSIGLSLFNHIRTDISKPTPTLGFQFLRLWQDSNLRPVGYQPLR